MINEDCIVMFDGEPIAYYIKHAGFDLQELEAELKKTKFTKQPRMSGIKPKALYFGYTGANPIANDFCNVAGTSWKYPYLHELLIDLTVKMNAVYLKTATKEYKAHRQKLKDYKNGLNEQYRIKNTVFTSGVLNKNCAFPYHPDKGNLDGVFSMMICIRKNMGGGQLILPEYGIGFACSNQSLLLFDGQKAIHGVTPLIPLNASDDCYRYTGVCYTHTRLWRCGSPEEELKRAQSKKFKKIQ